MYDALIFKIANAEMDMVRCGNIVHSPNVEALIDAIHRAGDYYHSWVIVNPGQPCTYAEYFKFSEEFSDELIDRLHLIGIFIEDDIIRIRF